MSRRDHAELRCPDCRLHTALCLCDDIAPVDTVHRLHLVVHRGEAQKTTNTGLLAARCLTNSVVTVADGAGGPGVNVNGGGGGGGGEGEGGVDASRAFVLFPTDDARPLTEVMADVTGPITLVVPDGTWAQTQKMRRRVPGLPGLPGVTLPDGDVTAYRLRAEPKAGGLSTLEAIARAFRVLEGDERGPMVEAALLSTFARFVERTLWMRGRLRDHELVYGLPAAARAISPRGGHADVATDGPQDG